MTKPEQQKTTPDAKTCHQCGSSISNEAPQALCPRCVLSGAANTSINTSRAGKHTPPPTLEEVASAFPDLEILELIGVGGMGAVFRARQKSLDREVALKILSSDLSADPAFAERFSREGRVLARLNNPNIVAIFDFGNKGPFSFLLMEYVDGVNLRQAMQAGSFTPAESLALVQDICSALTFAHEKGILHRDIKPENILIDKEGTVKIADFGIAKLVGENEKDDFTLTLQGSVMGSPQYMAPEQIETPDDIDQRADIYSLGVVLYELLTGELPLGRFAEPSKKATLDQRIDELVMRSLEKERESRFQSATELKTQVEAISQTPASIHNQGSSSPRQYSSIPNSSETSASNKYATLSAILTGLSLLIPIAGLSLITLVGNIPAAAVLVVFLLAGIPAVIGLIFGTKALGHIHRSSSPKVGLGAAIFGTWVWPQLLLLGLSISIVQIPFDSISNNYDLAKMILASLSLFTLLSGILCVINIYIWAKNGPNSKARHRTRMLASFIFSGVLIAICLSSLFLPPLQQRNSPDYNFNARNEESKIIHSYPQNQAPPENKETVTYNPGSEHDEKIVKPEMNNEVEKKPQQPDFSGLIPVPVESPSRGSVPVPTELPSKGTTPVPAESLNGKKKPTIPQKDKKTLDTEDTVKYSPGTEHDEKIVKPEMNNEVEKKPQQPNFSGLIIVPTELPSKGSVLVPVPAELQDEIEKRYFKLHGKKIPTIPQKDKKNLDTEASVTYTPGPEEKNESKIKREIEKKPYSEKSSKVLVPVPAELQDEIEKRYFNLHGKKIPTIPQKDNDGE